jgi:hypothetical protein
MLRKTNERYVEDQVRRYPHLNRSEMIRYERMEMWGVLGISLAFYGLVVTLLWFLGDPDFAQGAGSAYAGYLIAQVLTHLGRIAAFKRLMPEDY